MSKLEDLLHTVVNLLPWHQESDKLEAHETIAEEIPALLGRNATLPGVQETPATPDTPENPEVVNPWEPKGD